MDLGLQEIFLYSPTVSGLSSFIANLFTPSSNTSFHPYVVFNILFFFKLQIILMFFSLYSLNMTALSCMVEFYKFYNISPFLIYPLSPCLFLFLSVLLLLRIHVQCDSFGTRPNKMRISQRLFIRFWTCIYDYIPCFMRSMSILVCRSLTSWRHRDDWRLAPCRAQPCHCVVR